MICKWNTCIFIWMVSHEDSFWCRGKRQLENGLCNAEQGSFGSTDLKRPVQTGNVWWPITIKHCLVTKHFIVWLPCLVLFDRVWWCLKAIKHSIKQLKTFLLFSCLIGNVLFVWTAVTNMFGACMRTTLAQWLVFIDIASCLRKRRDNQIVTKCTQVQRASVSRENRHESFASFRGNLEYLRSSVTVRYYCSILSLVFYLFSSLFLIQPLVFPRLCSLFPSSSKMSRRILAAILFF